MICPGPLLDHKALEASGEFNKKDVLLVNFGAKSTNLIFKTPSGFLVRTLNIGQYTLTENIATLFSTKIEKAESLKNAYYSKIELNLDSQNIEKLESSIQNFYAKLIQEISRCLVTYKRLKRGKQPEEIIISGRGAQSSELLNILATSQKIKLSYFNPFNIVNELSSLDEDLTKLLPFILSEEMGFVYYLLPNTDKSHLVNLLPQKNIDSLKKKQKTPFLIASSIIFSILPLSSYIHQLNFNKSLTQSISEAKKIINSNLSTIEKSNAQEKELEKLSVINNVGHSFVDNLIMFARNTHKNIEIIDDLQSIINDNNISDVWLDTVKFLPTPETNYSEHINIEGRYLVRAKNEKSIASSEVNDHLIDSNSKKAELLTSIIEALPFTGMVISKTFSTEGKGDLFKRNFTHFSFTIKLK